MLFRGCLLAGALALAPGCSCNGGDFPDARGADALALGNVSLTWSLADAQGRPISCEQAGAQTVALELRNQSGLAGIPASFSCGNSPSTTQQVPAGTYNVSIRLNGSGATLAMPPDQVGVVVASGATAVLDPVTFTVDAEGGLALTVVAPTATSNCKPPVQGGAGITGTSLTLVDAGGNCAPVTFIRARGGTQTGTYTVSCSAPPVAPCLETDETLTVARMPSGPYTVHVRGKIAGVDCWVNNDAIVVPAQGKLLTRTLNLAHQSTAGCE